MGNRIFITGIGTGVGKTVVAAILAEALGADYWKPVQAGEEGGTDSSWVRDHIMSRDRVVHREAYTLKLPASPHIAAREENMSLAVINIRNMMPATTKPLVMEGAGGLLVPLNEKEFMLDLAKALDATVVLVSRNYLGSINHSLLTARVCRQAGLKVAGWVFNDQYMNYEEEIVQWSGYPRLASIPYKENPDRAFIQEQAARWKENLEKILC